MDLHKKKKIAAIMGAIAVVTESKIESATEEQEYVVNIAQQRKLYVPNISYPSPWTLYGRSYSMNLRLMWQSKMYK